MAASKMRFFLDEGVPDSVGRLLEEAGHHVIFMRDAIARGSPDVLVAEAAQANDAILVAFDGDMKQIARQHGVGSKRFKRLNLLKFTCSEPQAANRLKSALGLIEHEWEYKLSHPKQRMFVEITKQTIKTNR